MNILLQCNVKVKCGEEIWVCNKRYNNERYNNIPYNTPSVQQILDE